MHRAAVLTRPRALPRLPRHGIWVLAAIALIVAFGLWLRDSSLVAVQKVSVTGLTGPETARLTTQLEAAARDMTTLHVRTDQLEAVVRPYPVVKRVTAHASFPHTLRIEVTENVPVASVLVDGVRTPVGGDGRLLRGADQRALPVVPMSVVPTGDRVADKTALRAIAALAFAPPALRSRVQRAVTTPAGGLTLTLERGPELHFGGGDRLAAKWAAAAAVLADAGSAGATYLDLRYPERPAAGGLEDPATQRDPETANAALPGASTTTGAAATATPAGAAAGTTP
ncbi:cell division protein FtsQ/DivIB [Baekduia soli]|nr:cell division protein FtsQ/DivIB [Baekduia soli]